MWKYWWIIPAVLLVLALIGAVFFQYLIPCGQEAHARGSLQTVEEMANKAVAEHIPNGSYGEALECAEYAQRYYPVGSVLPESHPFASDYQAARQFQLNRIAAALSNATGQDFGTDWAAWRDWLDSQTNRESALPEASEEPTSNSEIR